MNLDLYFIQFLFHACLGTWFSNYQWSYYRIDSMTNYSLLKKPFLAKIMRRLACRIHLYKIIYEENYRIRFFLNSFTWSKKHTHNYT